MPTATANDKVQENDTMEHFEAQRNEFGVSQRFMCNAIDVHETAWSNWKAEGRVSDRLKEKIVEVFDQLSMIQQGFEQDEKELNFSKVYEGLGIIDKMADKNDLSGQTIQWVTSQIYRELKNQER